MRNYTDSHKNKKKGRETRDFIPKTIGGTIESLRKGIKTRVSSTLFIQNSGITNSVVDQIVTNSLLLYTGGVTNIQDPIAANLGKSYSKFRVTGYQVRVSWASRGTVESNLAFCHTPATLGISTGNGFNTINTQLSNPKTTIILVPAATKSPCAGEYKSPHFTINQIVGDRETQFDTNYVGASSSTGVFSDPSDPTYFSLVQANYSTIFTVNTTCSFIVRLIQDVEFYDLRG